MGLRIASRSSGGEALCPIHLWSHGHGIFEFLSLVLLKILCATFQSETAVGCCVVKDGTYLRVPGKRRRAGAS